MDDIDAFLDMEDVDAFLDADDVDAFLDAAEPPASDDGHGSPYTLTEREEVSPAPGYTLDGGRKPGLAGAVERGREAARAEVEQQRGNELGRAVQGAVNYGQDIGNAIVGGGYKTRLFLKAAGYLTADDPAAASELANEIAINAEAEPEKPEYSKAYERRLDSASKQFAKAEETPGSSLASKLNSPFGGIASLAAPFMREGAGDAVANAAKATATSPRAVGYLVAEQIANMFPTIASAASGAAAGAAAGSAIPGLGTATGAAIGGVSGMGVGEAAIETGAKVIEMLTARGIDLRDKAAVEKALTSPEFKQEALKAGLIKGATIAAVDMATMFAGGRILSAPARRMNAAVERELARRGVDPTDEVALETLKANPEFLAAIKPALNTYAKEMGAVQKAVRGVEAGVLETFGEGVGEGAGEALSGGAPTLKDVAMEMVGGAGQSIAQAATAGAMETGRAAQNKLAEALRADAEAAKAAAREAEVAAAAAEREQKAREAWGDERTGPAGSTPTPGGGASAPGPVMPNPQSSVLEAGPTPQSETLALPNPAAVTGRPTLNVTPEGQAFTDAQAGETAATMAAERERAAAAEAQIAQRRLGMEGPGDGREMTAGQEQAIRERADEMGYELQDSDYTQARKAIEARLPPGYTDRRLARDFYRGWLPKLADELVEGGGIAYLTDENDKITGRTPSQNPPWAQAIIAAEKTSVAEIKKTIDAALAGEKLGAKQKRIVTHLLDEVKERRMEEGLPFAREELAAARALRKEARTGLPDLSRYDEDADRYAGMLFDEAEYDPEWDVEARTLRELATEADAVDPEATEAILDSQRTDLEVARALWEIIGREQQQPQGTEEAEGKPGEGAPAETAGASDFQLDGYTEADLAAREKLTAERPEPPPPEDFTLTGSDAAADQAAAAGQTDLVTESRKADPREAVPDSAFNGDLEESLNGTFMSDSFKGDDVALASKGFTSDEIAALEAAGMATDGRMSREQYARWMDERSYRLTPKSKRGSRKPEKPNPKAPKEPLDSQRTDLEVARALWEIIGREQQQPQGTEEAEGKPGEGAPAETAGASDFQLDGYTEADLAAREKLTAEQPPAEPPPPEDFTLTGSDAAADQAAAAGQTDLVTESRKPTTQPTDVEESQSESFRGKYRDGTPWETQYRALKRGDGSYVIERTLKDEDGENVSFLTQDGSWRKGEAPRTTLTLGRGIEMVDGPETFVSLDESRAAIRDDAVGMGAEESTPRTTESRKPPKKSKKAAPGPVTRPLEGVGKGADYNRVRDLVIRDMGLDPAKENADGDIDLTDAQWAEVDRRIAEVQAGTRKLGGTGKGADSSREAPQTTAPIQSGENAVAPVIAVGSTVKRGNEQGTVREKKGHASVAGLDIAIENPAGTRRRPEWPELKSHYGYFKRTEGKDGDQVDVFVKPGTPTDWAGPVFVVDQVNADGKFDEHKVMLGFDTEAAARAGYLENYTKGWTGLSAITEMSQDEFKAWLADEKRVKQPAAGAAAEQTATPDWDSLTEFERATWVMAAGWVTKKGAINATGGKIVRRPWSEQSDTTRATLTRYADRFQAMQDARRDGEEAFRANQPRRVPASLVSDADLAKEWYGGWDTANLSQAMVETESDAPATPASNYGKNNTVFTEDKAAAARERLRKKLGRVRSGLDPEDMVDGVTLAGYHIEAGAREFADFVRAMVGDLGEAIGPYLKSLYEMTRNWPGNDASGMTPAEQVQAADVSAILAEQENTDVLSPGQDPESDPRLDPDADRVVPPAVQPDGGDADPDAGRPGGRAGGGRVRSGGRGGVSNGGAAAGGKRGDQRIRDQSGLFDAEEPAAGSDDRAGSPADRAGRPADEQETDAAAVEDAAQAAPRVGFAEKLAAQRAAESIPVTLGDAENIAETLPFLMPSQHEDVLFAENRWTKPDGYGVLFTNGTGTGKTYLGLGALKRQVRSGKGNWLIVVPSQKIAHDWIESAKNLGLDITTLADMKDAGAGVSITTYANFAGNRVLADRAWDGVIMDEAHNLMQNEAADTTAALSTLRAITLSPDGITSRVNMTHRDLVDEMEATRHKLSKLNITDDMMDQMVDSVLREKEALSGRMKEMQAEYNAAMDAARAEIEANQGEKRPRALFLSATPFAYEKNIQWAKGYLFDWSDEQVMIGNSRQGGYEDFMVRHFGYRIRYHKLTEPGPEVDRGLLQREFNTWLRQQGALSARMLEVDHDYDRKFVLVESQIGRRIDEALEWLRQAEGGLFYDIYRNVSDKFDYLTRSRLLQSLKAQEIVPYLQKQLELGRKAVVFYDFNEGGSFQVFTLPEGSDHTLLTFEKKKDDSGTIRYSSVPKVDQRDPAGKPFKTEETDTELRITAKDYYDRARKARPDIWEINTLAPNPRNTFRQAFGDVLAEYNGEVPTAQRNRLVSDFNDDRGGVKIIMAQKQANAGWSAHDTTGNYQRLLLNIGLPTAPVQSIQSEGRIYRVGQESDAMFRYVSIGTNWERFAFAERIARRAGTAENLAMGEDARALTESFVEAYEEAAWDEPGGENDGKGGKERDRALREAMTPFTKAKTYYFTQAKRTSKSKSYEGEDYYATPEPLGLKMVEWGLGKDGDEFLEPSAGHGAIARWFPPLAKRTVVEPSMELGSRLALATDAKLVTTSFEDFNIVNKADVIVMNPPFGRGGATAVRHLDKAVKHLRNGGRIVALIPEGPAADKAYDKWYEGVTGVYQRATYSLPRVTFERAGTSVKAKVIILDKYDRLDIKDEQARAAAVMDQVGFERGRWDIDAADINEFFDQIEDMGAPERPEIPQAADERPEASPAQGPEALGINVEKETHTKTGEDVWYGRINQKVDRDTYLLVKEVATKHGGYWSRFKGGGAKPGFIFPDEAAAQAFAAEVNQGPMMSRAAVTETPEFKAWFGDSKVVDQNGAPRVLYHGTAHSFGIFEGMVWGSVTPALANTYAEKEAYYRDDGMGHNVMPLYMRIEQPFDADVIRRGPVTVAEMFDAMLAQAGGKVPEKTLEKAAALQSTVKAGARIEESGPHYSAHDFWYDTRALFGKDGAAALSEAFRLLGFDGVKFTERGNLTYGAFLPGQVKSATGNAGTFGRAVDDIRMSSGSTTAGAVTATDINKVIDQQMKGMAARIQVHAVDRQADLPAFVLSMMKPGERPHGLYYMGHAWLIGENIASKRDVATHLAHEVFGHLAPEAVIDNWPEVEAFINRLVADGNPRAVSISNEVVRRYPDYAKGSPEYVREFIALTAERTRNGPLAKLMSMLRAALRRFLTSLGVKRFMEDAELDVILRNGEVFLRTDGAKSTRAPSPQQMASQREDQQAVWFSGLTRAVSEAPFEKGTPEQWRAWFKKAGVKDEEMAWLGMDEFYEASAHQKSIPKRDVEGFVRENAVRVEEIERGNGPELDISDWMAEASGTRDYWSVYDDEGSLVGDFVGATEGDAIEEAAEWVRENDAQIIENNGTRYSEYQLPGGENYRELLLTLPTAYSSRQAAENKLREKLSSGALTQEQFDEAMLDPTEYARQNWESSELAAYTSSHWDEPNILVHVRFNERTDSEGKRVLFIEELQSDWHQTGRRRGYSKGMRATDEEINRMLDGRVMSELPPETQQLLIERARIGAEGVPDAPFKTSWPMLAMKRMIRYAAEHGFDQIAWTTGAQQAERYQQEIEKIDHVAWEPVPGGKAVDFSFSGSVRESLVVGQDGKVSRADTDALTGKRLDEVVGKEIAERIMSEDKGDLRGVDITIGGEGMRGFYDKMLPSAVNKYVKKWGARTERAGLTAPSGRAAFEVVRADGTRYGTYGSRQDAEAGAARAGEGAKVRVGDEATMAVHALPITEAMRDSVMRGQPLFSRRDDARTILDYLRELAKHLDTFQLPRSDSKDFAEVVKAMRPSWTVKKGYFGDDNVYEIITENATALVFTANDRAGIKPGDNLVWVNVAEMREGQAGAVVYQAVATWAYNTGRVFIGDPDGLTDKAVVRRTEHMLSSALRHGTTRHLRPAADQAMPWKAGDDLGNMLALAEYSVRNMRQRYPGTKNLVYNFDTGEVVNTKSGRAYDSAQLERLGEKLRGVGVRAGRSTLARAALYNGLLQRAGSPEGVGLLADAALQRSGADRAPRTGRPVLEGLLYSRGGSAPRGAGLDTLREQPPLFESGFDLPSETLKDTVIRTIQDRMRRVKILERSIAEAGGNVSEQTSPYLGEELYHGRVAEALNDFQHDYVKPLLKAMGVEGVSMDDLDRYLYARHAKERNAHIAEIRPDMPDGGSGMTNAEADQVLASFGDRADVMENMAVKVDAINRARLDLLERESLEHPDQIALWRDRWQHYVPLRGWEDSHEQFIPGRGRGFDIRGKESKQALGRRSRADSPLLYTIAQMEVSIIRAEKNRVGHRMLDLALQNPNPKVWTVTKVPWSGYKPVFDRQRGEVVYRRDYTSKYADNVLSVKRDGQEYLIVFEDEGHLLARAMKNLGPDQANRLVRALGGFNRYLAAINTSLNLEFVISNFERDIQTALVNLVGEQDSKGALREPKKIGRQVMRDLRHAMRGTFNGIYDRNPNDEWTKWYHEFRRAGGKISFYSMNDLDGQRRRIRTALAEYDAEAWRELGGVEGAIGRVAAGINRVGNVARVENLSGKALHVFNAVTDDMANINSVVENAVRLAVYVNARRAGLSQDRAASLARNLTVNFTRKGEYGQLANSLYLFFNAGLQGSARLVYAVMSSPRVQKIMGGIVATSFLWAMMNRWIGGEDDDKEDRWDKLSNYIRTRHIVFMRPDGSSWKFPLPYGYNVPWVLGTYLERMAFSKQGSAMESAIVLLQAIMESFNPLGTADSKNAFGWISKVASPTITDPFVELGLNENFAGHPIFKEQEPWGPPKPDHMRYFNGVSTPSKKATRWIAELTGGDDWEEGAIDMNPEVVDYWASYLTGGAGRVVGSLFNLFLKWVSDDQEIETKDIPFYRRMREERPKLYTSNRYYDLKDEIDAAKKRSKAYLDQGQHDAWRAQRKDPEQRQLLNLAPTLKSVEKHLRSLYKQRRRLQGEDASKARTERLDRLEQEIENEQKRLIRAYNEAAEAA